MIDQEASAVTMPAAGKSRPRNEFTRFLVVGTVAALVNLICRYLLNPVMGYSAAILLAYLCGMVTAFILSKAFVFAESPLSTTTEFMRFTLVNVAAVIQVWAVSIFLAEWLLPRLGAITYAYDIAHLIGVAVPVFTSYLGHKHFSFSHR
ncbi:GtrA family protein [uncultured Thiodictyon sp.]|jgi:putative flippase GtrA|uniref:GtrA family protein n=1 Tax=uncultured Thiodictyon sp. TaxID=1846217 RepID=UPI0025F69726|nr:GtrA family protein [uncultured Thiodictyon sp.]